MIVVSLVPVLGKVLFFRMPAQSPAFDCDDSALLMYQRLSSIGITVTPIVGNLKMTGETFQEIDHVWLLVKIAGMTIAFDWGSPYFDRQHYEGYPMTYDQLVQQVEYDLVEQQLPASGP